MYVHTYYVAIYSPAANTFLFPEDGRIVNIFKFLWQRQAGCHARCTMQVNGCHRLQLDADRGGNGRKSWQSNLFQTGQSDCELVHSAVGRFYQPRPNSKMLLSH